MDIADKLKYRKYREAIATWDSTHVFIVNIGLPMLLFGSIGAITWAIRGSSGWGGIDGTIVPGMTWGLLWYYLCYRKGIDSRSVVLWLGLGIAIGGELGYGQYISWIMGRFTVGKEIEVMDKTTTYLELGRWQGYLWLMIAGASWGGLGGIFLGWALKRKTSIKNWCIRLLVPLGFAGLGWLLVRGFPSLFFPHYSPKFYTAENCPDCIRTIYTNTQNFIVLIWWIGALLVAKLQKDKPTMVTGPLLGVGFGIAFAVSAAWCLGFEFAPGYIDWWKMWELTAGFLLGCLYALALYWANGEVDKVHGSDGTPIVTPELEVKPGIRQERYRGISLILSGALLLYILFRGASCRLGELLGFYDIRNIDQDQYFWPVARTAIFVPLAVLIIGTALVKMWQYIRLSPTEDRQAFHVRNLHEKMTSLLVAITVVGVVTIWPLKIGVLYAVLLWVVIFAINRLNYHYDRIYLVSKD